MSSNYNEIYTGKAYTRYKIGDRFDISQHPQKNDTYLSCFHGLEIKSISDCITGRVLHFDFQEWVSARNSPRPNFERRSICSII